MNNDEPGRYRSTAAPGSARLVRHGRHDRDDPRRRWARRRPDGQQLQFGLAQSADGSVELAKTSHSQPAFAAAEYFAVHVLALDQEPLSNLFSRRGASKFSALAIERGTGGIPLLDGCAARFQCRTAFRYEGGDHEIFVGEVTDFKHFERPPLVFHRGRYSVVMDKQIGRSPDAEAGDGSFARDFLGFLLGKAHFRLFEGIRAELKRLEVSLDQYFALCALGAGGARTAAELDDLAQLYDRRFESRAALDLIARGLLTCEGVEFRPKLILTDAGRQLMLELLAIGKDAEATLQQQFDYSDAQALRTLLKRLVKRRPNPTSTHSSGGNST